jgi:hypothetical protein
MARIRVRERSAGMEQDAPCVICGGPAASRRNAEQDKPLCRFHVPEYEAVLEAQGLSKGAEAGGIDLG